MSLTVSILGILHSDGLADRVRSSISAQRYVLTLCESPADFLRAVQRKEPNPDCLLLEETPALPSLLTQLHQQSILLPSLILTASDYLTAFNPVTSSDQVTSSDSVTDLPLPHPHPSAPEKPQQQSHQQYHPAEVYLSAAAVGKLEICIDEAIKQFLRLSPSDPHLQALPSLANPLHSGSGPLQDQQRRLADKLRERLGYLGIYYKRDPRLFLRNLQPEEVAEVLSSLKLQYKGIVLSYFTEMEVPTPPLTSL
ncbi:MAG: hypothetical protein HC771_24945 [Synechococcales cyanobacterium CRU_2_2]|nr:hypothetical protein [Synechococcales cyanobacterium CRU_2_2]